MVCGLLFVQEASKKTGDIKSSDKPKSVQEASKKTGDIKSSDKPKSAQEASKKTGDIKSSDKPKSVFPDIQSILDEGVLRVAVIAEDRIPYFFIDKKGKLSGSDIELAKLIGQELGVEVEFIRTAPSFNAVIDQVSKGEAHLGASKLSYTPERARKVLYIDPPYITLHLALLINRSQLEKFPPGLSIEEIFSRYKIKITALKGSSQIATAQRMFPQAELIELETVEEINSIVLKGECFARVSDDSELTKLLIQNPEYNIKCIIVAFKEEEDNIYLVINHRFPTLGKYISLIRNNNPLFKLDLKSVFEKYEKDIKE
jgi:ABC-type amino acid transport substrate-binding protein